MQVMMMMMQAAQSGQRWLDVARSRFILEADRFYHLFDHLKIK